MEPEPRILTREVYIRVFFVGTIFTAVSFLVWAVLWLNIQSLNFQSGIAILDLGVSLILTLILAGLLSRYTTSWVNGIMNDVLSPTKMVNESKWYFFLVTILSIVTLFLYFYFRLRIGESLPLLFETRPVTDLRLISRYFLEFPMMGIATMFVGSVMVAGDLGSYLFDNTRDSFSDWRKKSRLSR